MADEFDVEAMLEAPYRKEDESAKNGDRSERSKEKRSRSKSRDRDRRSDRDRDRKSRDPDRRKSRSRDRDRDRDIKRRSSRSRSRERRRDRDRERERENRDRDRDRGGRYDMGRFGRDRDRDRDTRRSRSRDRDRRPERRRSRSPPRRRRDPTPSPPRDKSQDTPGMMRLTRNPAPDLTPEERDARTVFVMQLAPSVRPRDLDEFFSSVGKVRDVRIITDNKTRRSKGIAYVEFEDVDSVALAMGLSGQKLKDRPLIVQASQAEKNRAGNPTSTLVRELSGPMRLYVGSLHYNITEDMLKAIFEPFGKIDHINLVMDNETGRSKGFGFVTFHTAEDAKRALEQLNGFELAGRPMKCGHVTERMIGETGTSALDSDEMDRAGIDLGATGRLQLMAKLAEGTGMQLPSYAQNALNMNDAPPETTTQAPPIATQCFMLSNMFDPNGESNQNWDQEIKDDVIEECNKHGGVLHIFVDKGSGQGNVYVKCPSIAAAVASVQALHGRWFAGRVITAAYVPLPNYHQLFNEAQNARQLLLSSQQMAQAQAMQMNPNNVSGFMMNGPPILR